MQLPRLVLLTTSLLALAFGANVGLSQLVVQETISIAGTVESVSGNTLVVKDDTGKAYTVRVQSMDKESVRLAGGQFLRSPAEIIVTGSYVVDDLKAGQNIRFQCNLNRLGRTTGEVAEISLVTGNDEANGIKVIQAGNKPSDHSTCEIVAELSRVTNDRLVVKIPANNGFTRKFTLSIPLAKDAAVGFTSDDIGRAGAGSKVTKLVAVRLDTGDIVAKSLEIAVSNRTTARANVDDALLAKYRHLSDEPQKPRLIRSQHYAFMTDISERQARIILDKLETMVMILSQYFGQVPSGIVEGFIVHDLAGWPDGLLKEPAGIAKIQNEAGICFNSSLGNRHRAVLYSCDDHGVIQHECTHGFCHLAFGSTGPTWLAEGLAEMGQYWKFDKKALDINPRVIAYLQGSQPKRKLLEIAVPGRTDPGTWQDYAWRWALCHLLANNPNYSDRFKPLAIALMKNQQGASFEVVYGPTAQQLAFEYDLFLDQLDNGYRADLCAWQWNRKFNPLAGKRRTQVKVSALLGWQATGVQLEADASYDLAAVGNWKIAKDGGEYDADGDKVGRGQLVAVIYNNFKLSDPFPIGKLKSFVSPIQGQLFLRCQDDWNRLADNAGELTVHIRRTPLAQ
ncbi:MAG: hypothetical protein CMM07_07380 [Rhodopirellula sp.]|nr:hypothetical protein [Rhodopirellula sp.]